MDTSAPLVWNDSLMTGVPDIDEQHRILVHSLTEARAKLADETSPDVLEAITQDLLAYALYHFETEEALMHETGYTAAGGADARQHLAEHRDFSAQVVAMRSNLKAGIHVAPDVLLGFLNNWLAKHIMHTDKRFAAYMLGRADR